MIGRPSPSDFWAKLEHNSNKEIIAWHPLDAHCADVAAVAEALLTHTILRRRFARLLNLDDLTTTHIQRLSVLVALHDLGKVNQGFQNRAFNKPGPRLGHVGPILNFFFNSHRAQDAVEALKGPQLLTWFSDPHDFLATFYSSLSHHGRPVAAESMRDPRIWQANEDRDPLKGIKALATAVETWFPVAYTDDASPFQASPAFQHAFNGLVTLADWIGSNPEPDFFPYAQDHSDRMPWARERAFEVIKNLGLYAENARTSLGGAEPTFDAISEYPPYEIQQGCLDLPIYPEGSITILESDTGSGKTEAVLARFLRLFHAGLVDGLYFALPTRTAATQLHERVTKALKRAFPAHQVPPVVLAVPGYLRVDDIEGRRAQSQDPLLPSFEVLWPDDEQERWRYRGWAAENSKRYLAGTIAVGTVDQVLLSTLEVNHAHLRATSSLRHLLVIDEVHASDTYMTTLLQAVLDHHLQAGGHALLMSATLAAEASAQFLGNCAPSAKDAANLPYPLLHHAPASRTSAQIIPAKARDLQKEVHLSTHPIADDHEAIAKRALQAAQKGARVLIIRNLVNDCIKTHEALLELAGHDAPELFRVNKIPTVHHSRFAAPDRRALDHQIEADFGKDSTRQDIIAVATQTVEQSLDLDADLLITDLCPMDVLLQRIGRLHRHEGRSRPPQFAKAQVEVILPDTESLADYLHSDGPARGPHGLGTVYPDMRILEATRRTIAAQQTWQIPAMNRQLVEATTHSENLNALVEELATEDELWTMHLDDIRGANIADRTMAKLNILRRHLPFPKATYAKENQDQRPKTRLGQADRRVLFPKPIQGPFGATIFEINIPHHLAKDVPHDAETAENISDDQGLLRFDFGGASYQYGPTGLQRLS